jgi:hypothetical protein
MKTARWRKVPAKAGSEEILSFLGDVCRFLACKMEIYEKHNEDLRRVT